MPRCASLRGATLRAYGSRLASLRRDFQRNASATFKHRHACGARPAWARALKGLARRACDARRHLWSSRLAGARRCGPRTGAKDRAPRKAKGLAVAAFGRGGNALAVCVLRSRFGRLRAWRVLGHLRRQTPTIARASASTTGWRAGAAAPILRAVGDSHKGEARGLRTRRCPAFRLLASGTARTSRPRVWG